MAAGTLDLVEAAAHRTRGGMSLEVAIPARALPRFPARDDLQLELCLAYEDVDAEGAQPQKEISTCATGAPPPELLALPQAFRNGIRPRPPTECRRWKAVPGWLGFRQAVDPKKWVLGDRH